MNDDAILTVNLVDDDPILVDVTISYLKQVGYNAQGYISAETFFQNHTDFYENSVLLLDIAMPNIDGVEVLARVAKMSNPPSLILISGYDTGVLHSTEQYAKALSLSILASYKKPFRLNALQDILIKYQTEVKNNYLPIDQKQLDIDPNDLNKALQSDQLILYYQPQIDLTTRSIKGFEALMHWQHPDHGLLNASHFIELAENEGILFELSMWALDNVTKQLQQFNDMGHYTRVSMNISASDITHVVLLQKLIDMLDHDQLQAGTLTLELTERELIKNATVALNILIRLRVKGIKLSIDDFGMGHSSLSLLHKMPFSELKIDRSFVNNMQSDDEARAIVKTCIILGHHLNSIVVVEGVENEETWNLLRTEGCDSAQGFHIAKPMPGHEIDNWINNYNSQFV